MESHGGRDAAQAAAQKYEAGPRQMSLRQLSEFKK